MTLRERLLAGEHHGCASWAEVARKLGATERMLRKTRERMRAAGQAVELAPSIVARVGPFQVSRPETKWRHVEDFDAAERCSNRGDSDCDRGELPLDVIPECFSVREVSSQTDADGNLEKQWLGARRDSDRFEPIQPSMPSGHGLKGVSTLVDERGNVRAQWIKTSAINDERAEWMDAMRSLAEELPRIEPTEPPQFTDEDTLVVLPVGDPHIGLLAWWEDAGENFDMAIAERNLVAAFENLIARAPSAARCLLVFIGDNTHADGQNNTTTKGTRVDVDGRTMKMARTILNIIRRVIAMSLAKFGHAHVIIERGNHDELIAAMTALALSMFYENESRVTVDCSPEMYHWYRFGRNLIGTHHGDKAKPETLLGVMAVDRQQDWSETSHRRFYCGHYHHQIVKELPGLIVEYLPTLAGSDAWHRAMGYRSARAMYMDVFHREWGHVDRCIVGIRQVAA